MVDRRVERWNGTCPLATRSHCKTFFPNYSYCCDRDFSPLTISSALAKVPRSRCSRWMASVKIKGIRAQFGLHAFLALVCVAIALTLSAAAQTNLCPHFWLHWSSQVPYDLVLYPLGEEISQTQAPRSVLVIVVGPRGDPFVFNSDD